MKTEKSEKNNGEEIIDTKKRVTIYPTKECKHLKEGKPVKVGYKLAERLIKQGKATDKPAK